MDNFKMPRRKSWLEIKITRIYKRWIMSQVMDIAAPSCSPDTYANLEHAVNEIMRNLKQ